MYNHETMKKKLFSKPHRIMIALSSAGLTVAHLRRDFSAWVLLHVGKLDLPEDQQDFNEIPAKIRALTKGWKIPNAKNNTTWVSWILPADILAVSRGELTTHTTPQEAIASRVPYALNELKLSDFSARSKNPQTVYWMHSDWVQAFQQTAQAMGGVVDECYSRAQLFLSILPKTIKKQHRILLESDGINRYLHIYAANGDVLRTTKFNALQTRDAAALVDAVRREMVLLQTIDDAQNADNTDATEDADDENHKKVKKSVQSPVTPAVYGLNIKIPELRSELGLKELTECAPETLFLPLLKSWQTGVEIQATYEPLLNRANAWSLGWAVIGCALIGAMVSHDDELKTQIDDQRFELRRLTHNYQNAKAIRRDTLRMAESVDMKNHFAEGAPAFQPLAEVVMALNPPNTVPTRLNFYEKTGSTIRIEFTGGKLSAIQDALKKNKRFSDLKINTDTGIWEMQWNMEEKSDKNEKTDKKGAP